MHFNYIGNHRLCRLRQST